MKTLEFKEGTTSIFVKFRPSSVQGRKGSIFYRLIRKRKVKTITTAYRIYPEEWSDELSTVVWDRSSPERACCLREIVASIDDDLTVIKNKIHRLELNGDYSFDTLMKSLDKQSCHVSEFVASVSEKLKKNAQFRLLEAYRNTESKLMRFNGGKEFSLACITSETMEKFQEYMEELGNQPNTISFYMRNTRAIYNRAIKEKWIERQKENPFQSVFTGIAKTKKRAVKESVLSDLAQLNLLNEITSQKNDMESSGVSASQSAKKPAANDTLAFVRDIFILSFCLRGISFIDLAHLKKSNYSNGLITYIRHKTGQKLEVFVAPEAERIIEKYAFLCKDTEFLLPILPSGATRGHYIYALKKHNKHLKTISTLLSLETPLTTYVSRHSWASIALSKGYSISIISQGLGHDSEKTTKIYLDSFDYSALHQANNTITEVLKKVETGKKRRVQTLTA